MLIQLKNARRKKESNKEEPPMITQKAEHKRRKDVRKTLWTYRDMETIEWIAEQYAIRLDHLQVLLGQRAGHEVSPGTTRRLVARWREAG